MVQLRTPDLADARRFACDSGPPSLVADLPGLLAEDARPADRVLGARLVTHQLVGLLEGSVDSTVPQPWVPPGLPSPWAWLSGVYVDQQMRRKGVGRALVGAFARHAAEGDCSFVVLRVASGDGKSGRVRFFERLGFTALPMRPGDQNVHMGAIPAHVRLR